MKEAVRGATCRAIVACALTASSLPDLGRAAPVQECLVVGIADGDTLTARCGAPGQYQQTRVRLAGIDAPEKRQPYGQRARQTPAGLAFQRMARLECFDSDRYGRSICTVWAMQDTGQQIDVGQAQIEQGMAWWYRAYANVQPAAQRRQYEAAELAARTSRVGLWRDPQPVPPWDWRRSEKAAQH